ncbi:MAG TPA: extracellular solute-binding protein [Xanthobacteraceae bacterium]|nr:extracellular solute-binding protein [Xanthobacteraceae bacterium]
MRIAAAPLNLFVALLLATGWSAQPAVAQGASIQKQFSDLYQAALKEGEAIFYTDGRQDEAQRLSDYWKTNFPGVALRIVPKSSPAVIAQIETERAAGQHRVDVSHMSQPYVAALWKQKGFYQPYRTQSFERLRPDNADPDGAFYTPDVYVLPAAFNTSAFKDKALLPRSFKDFLDPKWKGRLVLGDPDVSGNTLTFLMTMLSTGRLDWSMLEGLAKQDILFVRSNPDAVRMVASGERVLSPMISSFNIMTARLKGQPIDYYVLDEGSVVVQSMLGLMRDAPHPNAAKLLIEVMTSPQAESALSEGGVFWPAHPDAPPPGMLPRLAELHPIAAPPPSPADVQEFLKRFKAVFGRQ